MTGNQLFRFILPLNIRERSGSVNIIGFDPGGNCAILIRFGEPVSGL